MNELILDTKPAGLLLVDDEPNVLKSLRRLFRGGDFEVHLANNGEEALTILEQHNIDLIISDMRMPQMDGAELLGRAAQRWPEIVRILLTGFADMESTIVAVNKGKIYSYCQKPWDDSELESLVRKALEQKRLVEERAQLFDIIHQQNEQLSELNSQLEVKVKQRTEQLRHSFKKLDKSHQLLNRQYTETIKSFARIIEMRPGIKSGHAAFIAEIAHKVAIQLDMSDAEKKNVLYAGLLLQIGKMRFADSLLNQAFFTMSSSIRDQYLSHALEGEALLKNMALLNEAAVLIRYQFEHFDGSGYPEGRKGEDIPLGARILAVVRDYISFLEGSMTGQIMTVANVIGRLKIKKNSFYDPTVIDAFLQVLTQMEKQAARPVVEISWSKLEPGMEIDEISYNGRMFLKDCIIDKAKIYEVVALREKVGDRLKVKVRLGDADQLA